MRRVHAVRYRRTDLLVLLIGMLAVLLLVVTLYPEG